ncbi:7643_t:CDS:2, partial [Cetraspora pellucida]
NENNILYDLSELEEQVAIYFTNLEDNQEVEFSKIFEFENELIDNFQILNNVQETHIRNIVPFFLLPIEAGSHYYWEYNHSANQPVKRISKARPPIDRFLCDGKITININFDIYQAKIEIIHLIPHIKPTYRENKLPESAIEWISKNINRNFRKIEIYKRLCEEKLIDSKIHTYNQVYYWSLKFSAQQYLTNSSNQLLSSLNFLNQTYLYVDTFAASNDLLKDPKNKIHSRLKVLREFFLVLRNEDILPIFVVMDKDTGQIMAVQEAWSFKIKIQLCL